MSDEESCTTLTPVQPAQPGVVKPAVPSERGWTPFHHQPVGPVEVSQEAEAETSRASKTGFN